MKNKKNRGFTLVELIVVISIFAILLGIMVPSLNSLLGFEAQRATESIAAALDRTKTEAMSRLVGEMKLEHEDGGCYVTYYLDRGKGNGLEGTDKEQVAKKNVQISYVTSLGAEGKLKDGGSLILTFNRDTGGFRKIQTAPISKEGMTDFLEDSTKDLMFWDDEKKGYCSKIIITSGMRTRTIELHPLTGTYTITAN